MTQPAIADSEIEKQQVLVTKQLLGADFLQSLFLFFKATETHEPSNKIFDQALDNLYRTSSDWTNIFGFESLDLLLRGEQFFINDRRIRPKSKIIKKLKYIVKFLRQRKILGFRIDKGHKREDLLVFLWTIVRVRSDEPGTKVIETLRTNGLEGYEIKTIGWNANEEATSSSLAEQIFDQIYAFVKECFLNKNAATEIKTPLILDQVLYELHSVHPDDFMNCLCRRSVMPSDCPPVHRAVTTAYTLHGWGRALGLPPFVVVELSICGLLHIFTGRDVRQQITAPEPAIQLFENLLRLAPIWPHTDLQLTAVLEYGISFGEKGVYELAGRRCYLHFFSRLLRIAAVFQQMISIDRRTEVLSPTQALDRLLTEQLGCDPSLVRLFAGWLGLYPVGSFVKLKNGEIGQVCSVNSDLNTGFRPKVIVLNKSESTPRQLDLSEIDQRIGVHRQAIVSSVSFSDTGLSLQEYDELTSHLVLSYT